MTKTILEGWTEEEYKAWSASHPDEAKTSERTRLLKEDVKSDYRDQTKPRFTGYAAVFNSTTELWSGFFERVAPGAFTKSIKADDIRALWNHNPDHLLGRTKVNTLILEEDSRGLRYEIIRPDTSIARDLEVLIKRGDVSQSSFGFNIVEQSLKYDKENDTVTRTLNEVKLFDVSPVTFPAYESTEVHVRANDRNSSGNGEVIVVGEIKPPQQLDADLFAQFDALKKQRG